MKNHNFIFALVFSSCFIGCQSRSLKKTVRLLTHTVSNTKLTQQEFIANLKPLIDPDANVDSLCTTYFNHWKNIETTKGHPITTKVKKIEKETDSKAKVFIANTWHQGTGEKNYFLSKTTWVRKNKKWFRTSE
ncbi:MAG: hypothetical protein ACHQII_01545, partial [Bacteroidia bacterium]